MYMINVRLVPGLRPLDGRELRRSVLGAYAEVGADGADLVLFVSASTQAAAHAAARRVVTRSLRVESLRGWVIQDFTGD